MKKTKKKLKTVISANKRWESGTDHHPKSVALFEKIRKVVDWKDRGDGDNGEELMYQLDVIFEAKENKESKLIFG